MKIEIKIHDEDNGHVRVTCKPPLDKLVQAWKSGDNGPALTYAILGLSKMLNDSDQVAKEKQMDNNPIVLPNTPRFRMPPDIH